MDMTSQVNHFENNDTFNKIIRIFARVRAVLCFSVFVHWYFVQYTAYFKFVTKLVLIQIR